MDNLRVLDQDYLDSVIPVRRPDTHKGIYGKVLVIGGCVGYSGAPFLSAQASFRTGSGLVYLAAPNSIYGIQASRCQEIICLPFEDRDGKFSLGALEALLELADRCDVCVLGPGMGRSGESDALICELVSGLKVPLVLDADGINAVSANINILAARRHPTVLTPHDIEFTRLGGTPGANRLQSAQRMADFLGAVVVLKGNRTLVCPPGGKSAINIRGNPGMAKGGSGDLLAGVIGSLMGQGLSPFDAAASGVFIHATAGDLCSANMGEYGMLPTDYMEYIPVVLKKYRSK